MSELMEKAHETIEEHSSHSDPWSRRVAILVSVLAAVLALAEIGGKAAENAYLTRHIALSNEWAFYQARNLRSVMRTSEAEMLASLPNAQDPAIQARIKDAQDYSARMRDDPKGGEGMKQLADKARAEEAERDEAAHRYHNFEYAVGALQLGIVLASVSVVTRVHGLAWGAGALGVGAAAATVCIALNLL